jgi:hypothetical protein
MSAHAQSSTIRRRALVALKSSLSQNFPLHSPPPVPPKSGFITLLSNFLTSRASDHPSSQLCLECTTLLTSLLASYLDLTIHSPLRLVILKMSTNVLSSCDVNNLARVARSAAFDLIATTASSLEPRGDGGGTGGTASGLGLAAKEFTETAARVLEGEKDPRCLIRGLEGIR